MMNIKAENINTYTKKNIPLQVSAFRLLVTSNGLIPEDINI